MQGTHQKGPIFMIKYLFWPSNFKTKLHECVSVRLHCSVVPAWRNRCTLARKIMSMDCLISTDDHATLLSLQIGANIATTLTLTVKYNIWNCLNVNILPNIYRFAVSSI